MEKLSIRQAHINDLNQVAELFHLLWSDTSPEDHAREIAPLLEGKWPGTLPGVVLLAEYVPGEPVGFIEAGLRSHADGCDPAHAVGYIEGWFVRPDFRRRKVGSALADAAEQWARERGCVEMASDAWLDAHDSQRAHESLGFEVVDRCVHYRKTL